MIFLEIVPLSLYKKVREDPEIFPLVSSQVFNKQLNLQRNSKRSFYCLIRLFGSQESKIVGTVSYRHTTQFTKLRDFEIFPSYRSNGYGKETLEIIINQARNIGSMFLSLFVFDHRTIAQSLYQQFGFVPTKQMDNGREMVYYLSNP